MIYWKNFFSDRCHISCAVILQKFFNNTVKHYSMVDHEQTNDNSYSKKDITDKRDS
jgi:hypothetical protein